jgi:hypothetical protein
MAHSPKISGDHEILVISNDSTIHSLLQSEIERLNTRLPLVNPRITRSLNLQDARHQIGEVQPTLIVLDPETPPSDGMQSLREIPALLDRIGAKSPILVALPRSDGNWARETILRPGLLVWNWDNKDSRLEHLLPLLLKPSKTRRLRAVIRLRQHEPVCDIHIGDASLFQNLRLNVKAVYRRNWREDDLQYLFDMENRATAWTSLADKGNALFNAILDEFGGALVDARDQGTALDLRFEIDPDESSLFAMPIELLNREGKWEGFFCRITAMARRVKPRKVHEHRNAADRPVLLFVDASATRGTMQVIGLNGEPESRSFRDLSGAVAAEQDELEGLAKFCRLEVLKPEEGTSLKDALRDRLSDTSKPPPEIIHFTGHAISPRVGSTELVFPSSRLGEVERLSVEVFATWLPEQVQLVVLSACQGISVDTARFLHAARGIAVLGFRCEVQARAAAEFMVNFYKERLKQRESIADAYKTACFMGNVANSAWAAAVLLDHD